MKTLEEVREERREENSSLSAAKNLRDSLEGAEKIDLADILKDYENLPEDDEEDYDPIDHYEEYLIRRDYEQNSRNV